jgi:hypothetical protein
LAGIAPFFQIETGPSSTERFCEWSFSVWKMFLIHGLKFALKLGTFIWLILCWKVAHSKKMNVEIGAQPADFSRLYLELWIQMKMYLLI